MKINLNKERKELTSEQFRWLDQELSKLPVWLRYNDEVSEELYELDGQLYIIFYRRDLSNWYYTKHFVYDVLTQEGSWGKTQKGIAICLEDDSIPIGQYRALNDTQPSFDNYLRKHHKMENVGDTNIMRYTIIEPYDD